MKMAVLLMILALAGRTSLAERNLIRSRIIGGYLDPLDYLIPWIASLRNSDNEHFCSGSLIAPTIVLTAAHCLKRGIPPSVDIGRRARIGDDGSEFETRTIVRAIMHEEYNYHYQDNNDIAILILNAPSTKLVATIAATDRCFGSDDGCLVKLLGWGTSENGSLAEVLEFGYGRSMRTSDCDEQFTSEFGTSLISDTMICAHGINKAETCLYDSGGPLLLENKVVGIVSWGTPVCGQSLLPGVYSSVPKLRPWLDEKLEELSIRL